MVLDRLSGRRTYKVIGDPAKPVPEANADIAAFDSILCAAGNAPFHYACDRTHQDMLGSPVPWRCYNLATTQCQALMRKLLSDGDQTKIPNMLAAAEYLAIVTWLPDPGTISEDQVAKDGPAFTGTMRNMEHIAAAGAFAQSFLLAADSGGFKTYWSSGGPLRGSTVFNLLKIPETELLLGAIFLFPENPQNAEIKPGAMAEKRGTTDSWSRWCKIDNY